MELDLAFVRSHFPALAQGWALFDNAGGSVVPRQVSARVHDYMTRLGVQLGASYPLSEEATAAVDAGVAAAASLVGGAPDEVVIGPSTTMNVYVLAHALAAGFAPGDEIVVTNLDHEANAGAWERLAARGLVVREWRFRPETLRLEPDDLAPLLNERTRLVCCAHVSNLVGAIHDVRTIAERAHAAGALVCVDGVAYAPHRRVDVAALDVDFYLASLYKVFGPHLGLLYIRRDLVQVVENQNHGFLGADRPTYKLEPGYVNHELTAALPGILDYLGELDRHHRGGAAGAVADAGRGDPGRDSAAAREDGLGAGATDDAGGAAAMLARVFSTIAAHEARLARPLLDFLSARRGVRVVGPSTADPAQRVPTISFTVDGRHASEIPARLDQERMAVRWGDFYAPRLVDALDLSDRGGVVRVSMVHYNTEDEVTALIEALDRIL